MSRRIRFTGWVMDYEGEEQMAYKFKEVVDAETLLVGRVTYESFAGAWPDYEGEFADKMNSMPKVVVSNTLKNPEWNNTTVLEGDVVAGIRALKEQDGGPILVHGSTTLVHTLLDHDLVDTLRLMVFPVTIGARAAGLPRHAQEVGVEADRLVHVRIRGTDRHISPGLTPKSRFLRPTR